MGVRDPGKSRFLVFARGDWGSTTLANRVFWTLPGVRCDG